MVSASKKLIFSSNMRIFLWKFDRSTFQSRWKPTARSAPSTLSTRSLSTRRVRTLCWDREREDMMPNRRASVVRPSPSSERSPRQPRRSLSSLNAPFARPVDSYPSSVASHSFSERRMSPRVAPSSEHSFSEVLINWFSSWCLFTSRVKCAILNFYFNPFKNYIYHIY